MVGRVPLVQASGEIEPRNIIACVGKERREQRGRESEPMATSLLGGMGLGVE